MYVISMRRKMLSPTNDDSTFLINNAYAPGPAPFVDVTSADFYSIFGSGYPCPHTSWRKPSRATIEANKRRGHRQRIFRRVMWAGKSKPTIAQQSMRWRAS